MEPKDRIDRVHERLIDAQRELSELEVELGAADNEPELVGEPTQVGFVMPQADDGERIASDEMTPVRTYDRDDESGVLLRLATLEPLPQQPLEDEERRAWQRVMAARHLAHMLMAWSREVGYQPMDLYLAAQVILRLTKADAKSVVDSEMIRELLERVS